VLILLPPSEGKSAPQTGPALSLSNLSFPALSSSRTRVLRALVDLCRGGIDEAAGILGLGPTQRGEVGANARLRKEPCGPAIEVYTGVLYEALNPAGMRGRARDRLSEHVAIASALWGLVRPGDLIPSYRLSGGVSLPGIGTLTHAWRDPLGSVLEAQEGLIVDLRSSVYEKLAPVPDDALQRTVTVRVLNERNGKRTVVSHSNKHTKGLLVGELLHSRRTPRSPRAFLEAVQACGFDAEWCEPMRGRPAQIDVILQG
jgi:cytoplasmic iron level regulating protein YaaA (DUF328/UPF0246 family)